MSNKDWERRYPVGIQTFERIIDEGYIYVDKTDLVWRLQNVSPFVFLSRPRRFGKSLSSSTLHSFFEDRKDLFYGFKKKLEEVATVEGFYEYTMYLIFSMLNVYVQTQVKCSGRRADMVVHMPNTTYVFELKINGTAQQALNQINCRDYVIPYQTEDKNVGKVGIRTSIESKNIED